MRCITFEISFGATAPGVKYFTAGDRANGHNSQIESGSGFFGVIEGACLRSGIRFGIDWARSLTHDHCADCLTPTGATFASYVHMKIGTSQPRTEIEAAGISVVTHHRSVSFA
jgi:hypothetical protein